MNEREQEQYLKNLVLLSRADGKLSPEEEHAIEAARKDIGAKKPLLKKILRSTTQDEPDPSPITRFSNRLRNLEDMVALALVDGELSGEEKKLLGRYARLVGLSQEQLNLVVREARERVQRACRQCPSCGRAVERGARYCPSCGTALQETAGAEGRAVELPVARSGITLAFAESSSAAFPRIVDLAKRNPGFCEIDRQGRRWFALGFSRDEIGNYLELIKLLSALRNREVYVDGRPADWNATFRCVRCALRRAESYQPVEYCFGLEDDAFNVWGCKELRLGWSQWSELFTCGKFVSKTDFEFDLQRIAHLVRSRLREVELCPHIRPGFIRAVLRAWPLRVSVGRDTGWSYRRALGPDPRAIKVKISRPEGEFVFSEEFYAIGVAPEDPATARRVLEQALQSCAQGDISMTRLRLG